MHEPHFETSVNIRRHGVTIGLQHDLPAVMCRLPDVREPPCGYWVIADELDFLWTKPTTSR